MDLQELNNRIKEFVAEREWDQYHNPKDLAQALNIEAAELMELFLWISTSQADRRAAEIKEKLADELGDILIYLIMLADRAGINLVDAGMRKMEKNRKNYPVSLSKGSSRKYTEL